MLLRDRFKSADHKIVISREGNIFVRCNWWCQLVQACVASRAWKPFTYFYDEITRHVPCNALPHIYHIPSEYLMKAPTMWTKSVRSHNLTSTLMVKAVNQIVHSVLISHSSLYCSLYVIHVLC